MEKTNSCTHQPRKTASSIYGISSGADQDLSPQRGSENFEGIPHHHVPLSSKHMLRKRTAAHINRFIPPQAFMESVLVQTKISPHNVGRRTLKVQHIIMFRSRQDRCYMEKTNSCTHQPLHNPSSNYGISSGADQDLSPQRGSENFEGITHHVPLSSRQMIHEENKQLHASTASYRLKHLWNQFWCRPRSLPTTWVGEL